MKRQILVLILLGIILPLHAELEQKKLNSSIKSITLYQSAAMIHREANTTLSPGIQELLLTELSPFLNDQSIQVGGSGDLTILSVSSRVNYLTEPGQPKEYKRIRDSLDLLQPKVQNEQALLYVYQQEEQMLNQNRNIGGQQNGINVTDLVTAVEYYRKRMTEVKKLQLATQARINDLNQVIQRLNNQLSVLGRGKTRSVSEIVILVNVERQTSTKLKVSYLVGNAGWMPTYDIQVKDIKNPANLLQKAKIRQSTGVEWKNVRLTLSTADPSQTSILPVLYPWYLNYVRPVKQKKQRAVMTRDKGEYLEMEDEAAPTLDAHNFSGSYAPQAVPVQTAVAYTVVYDAEINVEYQISIPYTIPSDGSEMTIEVATYEMDASYTYFAVPKLNTDAFLKARITGWEKYNILPGDANIFFEGTLVGTTYIDARYAEDTLDLSLGRDERIMIEYIKVKDSSSRSIIGASKKESHVWEIKVRNNKKEDINITIEDQIPVSKTTDIEITNIEKGGGRYNSETGKVTWEIKLTTGESTSIRFGFNVRYPKEYNLYIR